MPKTEDRRVSASPNHFNAYPASMCAAGTAFDAIGYRDLEFTITMGFGCLKEGYGPSTTSAIALHESVTWLF